MKRPNINKNSPQRRRPQQQNNGQYNNNYSQQQSHPQPLEDSPSKPLKQQYTPKQPKYQQQTSYTESEILLTPALIHKSSSLPIAADYSLKKGTPNTKSQYTNTSTKGNTITLTTSKPVNTYSTSPPRGGYESPKKVTSPQSTAWAGGAFNNSPAPSALPLPNFEDFQTQQSLPDLQTMTFDLRRLLNIAPTVSVSD
eukprot:gene15091-17866_t